METFSRLSSLLLQALETREPTVDLLDSFIDHWRSVTTCYIQTSDDSCPVSQTDIPWRLRQMLDILVYEETQLAVEDTGPCLEYLLEHKLLETLCMLGKAQYPPGMFQQVLLFFNKLLTRMQKPLLELIRVYRPVQRLINLCALPGCHVEKEEVQFLLAVCSRVKQDPHTLRCVLELLEQPPGLNQSQHSTQASNQCTDPACSHSQTSASCPVQSESSATSPVQSESSATSPGQSESSATSPGQSESSATSPGQSESSATSPGQSESSATSPGQSESSATSPGQSESSATSPGQSESRVSGAVQTNRGLLWALLQLTKSQRASVRQKASEGLLLLAGLLDGSSGELLPAAVSLAELLAERLQELHRLLPLDQLDATELQRWPCTSWRSEVEPGHMTSFFTWFDFLDHLMCEAPQVLSVQVSQSVHRRWLVDTLHPQLSHTCEKVVLVSTSMLCATIRLVQSSFLLDQMVHFLLRTPSLMRLLLRHCNHISDQISMASMSLVDEMLQKPHRDILDILVLSFLQSRCYVSAAADGQEDKQLETNEDSQDLDDDPFFSDGLSDGPPAQPINEDVVNSFLCLVPIQARSAHLLQEGGYESYVHDAHTLVTMCHALSLSWEWPQTLPCPTCLPEKDADFFEGDLLKVLFDRLGCILEQPYELSLKLTSVLSRLSAFSHPLLDEYLLDPYVHLSPGCRSLFSVLIRVMAEVMQRIQQVSDLSEQLLDTRRHLLGLSQHTGSEHLTLLKGIIVLEEFCKELAAIAFVKKPLNRD
ncbi:FHF complex subunit HOOK-interacting protein 2B [Nothobranchius furzeri]